MAFKESQPKTKITNFVTWNKASRVLIKLITMKWPALTFSMVQYSAIISNLQGKFPFAQAYSYDKKFHKKLATTPGVYWSVIDNQLWSQELHGTALPSTAPQPQLTLLFAPAMTLLRANAHIDLVNSHISALNASGMATQLSLAESNQAL